eukprot:TRINITY_DN24966_c0_g1_i1.p1 TRINITY_DN24966_c0_g1~~TRINITY_DN24966_c0_g1_i1.p1  ORF type:complete len:180 (-),score=17.84 TRINITY_DN24966_c0_g1_i1:125-664(-)
MGKFINELTKVGDNKMPLTNISSTNPFGTAESVVDFSPLQKSKSSIRTIIDLDQDMLFEEKEFNEKLLIEPMVDLRLPLYDVIKYLVYIQCELCEFASGSYSRLINSIYDGILQIFNHSISKLKSAPRNALLQLLFEFEFLVKVTQINESSTASKCFTCLLYTSPSPRDLSTSRMPSSA